MREFKVVVLGSGGVGKSALTVQFVSGSFMEKYDPTIEDFYRKEIEVDAAPCVLEILDTAGTEQFASMRDLYIKNGQGFVVVYSITSQQTFQDVRHMKDQIVRVKSGSYSGTSEGNRIPILLVGNKVDLDHQREVSTHEGMALAQSWGCPFMETSAKNRFNVNEVFAEVVREMSLSSGKDNRKFRCCNFLSHDSCNSCFCAVLWFYQRHMKDQNIFSSSYHSSNQLHHQENKHFIIMIASQQHQEYTHLFKVNWETSTPWRRESNEDSVLQDLSVCHENDSLPLESRVSSKFLQEVESCILVLTSFFEMTKSGVELIKEYIVTLLTILNNYWSCNKGIISRFLSKLVSQWVQLPWSHPQEDFSSCLLFALLVTVKSKTNLNQRPFLWTSFFFFVSCLLSGSFSVVFLGCQSVWRILPWFVTLHGDSHCSGVFAFWCKDHTSSFQRNTCLNNVISCPWVNTFRFMINFSQNAWTLLPSFCVSHLIRRLFQWRMTCFPDWMHCGDA